MKLSADIDRKDQQIRQIRRQLDEAKSGISQINTNKAVMETKLENNLKKSNLENKIDCRNTTLFNRYITNNSKDNLKIDNFTIKIKV